MSRTFNFKKFREEFAQAVSKLEKKHSIQIDIGKIRYDSEEFRTKMTCTFLDAGTDVSSDKSSKEENTFKMNCHLFTGLTPEHYHKAWNDERLGMCRFVMIKTANTRYPIIVEQMSSGQRYKLSWGDTKSRIGNLDKMKDTK